MTSTTKNLASQFLEERGLSVQDYEGFCGELADAVIHWLGEDRVSILYVEQKDGEGILHSEGHAWRYHMVPLIAGLVHDAWTPSLVATPERYIAGTFPEQDIVTTIYGDEVPAPR